MAKTPASAKKVLENSGAGAIPLGKGLYRIPMILGIFLPDHPNMKEGIAMDVFEAIQKRTTIRSWKPVPVEKEKIVKVLEAGRRAPSWGNTQPWRYVVVQDKAKIGELAKTASNMPQVATAPVVIVCCGFPEAFSRKMHRESLVQLREIGAADWPDEVLDKVILESDLFAPYRLGQQAMVVKAAEQLMISIAYMTLEALNQGLGTCWIGTASSKDAHKVMGLPDDLFVHDLLPVGYPGEDPKPRPRKALDQIVFWEKYL
jgi:nitroreductase